MRRMIWILMFCLAAVVAPAEEALSLPELPESAAETSSEKKNPAPAKEREEDTELDRILSGEQALPVLNEERIAAKVLPNGAEREKMRKLYTGFDDLSPENPTLKLLAETPLAPEVPCHSVIGNNREPGVPGGSDGVVTYESSHLDNVESERIVKSGHSVQESPECARELVRILRLHLRRTAKNSASGLEKT